MNVLDLKVVGNSGEEIKVIMSVEVYESTMKRLNMYRELELSERQIETGKTKDARQSLDNLREKFAI